MCSSGEIAPNKYPLLLIKVCVLFLLEPIPEVALLDEGCQGESSREHFDSTYIKEFCDDSDKMESYPRKLEPGFTQETPKNGLNSSSVSVLCIEDNRVASDTVSGEYALTTDQASDAEMTRVSNSSSLTKIQKVILLSPADQFRTIPRDGNHDGNRDGILRDKTRQLMVTTPVNAKTLPHDSGHDKSLCDKTRRLMVTPPVITETLPRDKTRGLLVTAPIKLPTTAPAIPNATVQTSSSYASRFVLPRETSTFSSKQLGFVEITSDISQSTSKVLTRNNGLIGRRASFNSYQGRTAVRFTWNRPHLRARPLGRVSSADKRFKCPDKRTLARVS